MSGLHLCPIGPYWKQVGVNNKTGTKQKLSEARHTHEHRRTERSGRPYWPARHHSNCPSGVCVISLSSVDEAMWVGGKNWNYSQVLESLVKNRSNGQKTSHGDRYAHSPNILDEIRTTIWHLGSTVCVFFCVAFGRKKKGKNSFTLVKLDKSFSPPDINQTWVLLNRPSLNVKSLFPFSYYLK